MNRILVPFSPPRIDQKIIDEVTDTLKSGWITTGPKTRLFEERLTVYGGQKATLCVNSATAGLELILRWFGVTRGDEVILPAYTYAATANVIVHCGAVPVFVDSGDDFNISLPEISRAITSRTKVIIPVDIGGWPCDYDPMNELVQSEENRLKFRPATPEQSALGRILVLSDAAHSIGAVYKGRKTGSLTDITVFSFHAVKNLTTAEGGAVCLNLPEPFQNEDIVKNLRVRSLHGQTKDALSKMQLGTWRYDIVEPGYKCNMTDIQASIGLVELKRYDRDMLVRRKQVFDRYSEAFRTEERMIVPVYETEQRISSYHVYLLRLRDFTEAMRDRVIELVSQRGVAVNVHFIPLPMMSYYRNQGYHMDDYPVAYRNYSCEISLPVYYDLTDEQADLVIESVKEAAAEVFRSMHS